MRERMNEMEIHWNTLLLQQLAASQAFADAMDAQLGEQARQMAGIDLLDGRFSILPVDGDFEVERKRIGDRVVSAVEVDLIGPDGAAEPAVVAWSSKQRAGEPVDPSSSTDGDAIQFFWARFPIEEMQRYASKQTHAITATARFPVTTSVFGWPDVMVVLELDKVDEDVAKRVAIALDDAIERWNATAESKIHHRGPVRAVGAHTLQVHVDFGSASPDAMGELVEALDTAFAAGEIIRCSFSNPSSSG